MRRTDVTAADTIGNLVKDGWRKSSLKVESRTLDAAVLDQGARRGLFAGGVGKHDNLLVSCFYAATMRTGGDYCNRVVRRVVTTGLPAGLAFPPASLHIGDRALTVPPECKLRRSDDTIVCPTGEMHWRNVDEQCRTDVAQQRVTLMRLFQNAGEAEERTAPCTILGSPAQCSFFNIEPKTGGPITSVAYFGGCAAPTVQCNMPGALTDTFPEPCDQVFAK